MIYKFKGLTNLKNPRLWDYLFYCDRCKCHKLSTEANLVPKYMNSAPSLLVCNNCVDVLNPHDIPVVPRETTTDPRFLRPDKDENAK